MNTALQAAAAKEFAEKWKGKGYEKGESQKFWFDLLKNVYGVDNPTDFMECEVQVMLEHTSFIDVYLPSTKVMIEQKSIGKDLSKPIKQSDGTMLTPMQQLKRYAAALGYYKYPRWGITCNFEEFYIYDMANPNSEPEILKLADLPKEYNRLNFLVDTTHDNIKKELEVSLNAGTLVGKMYEYLYEQYGENPTPKMLKSLNMLIVRLVFCMYAEDAGIFGRKDMFMGYLNDFRPQHFRKDLIDLFEMLDTPVDERDPYEEKRLLEFPYVNGGLFSDDSLIIPQFNQECVDLIIKEACTFDWAEISPTIFGAVFESTIASQARRAGGMHYTSVENIHKVIDPLFLNDLKAEYEKILEVPQPKKRENQLKLFQDKLASLTFFDPACGSGNFLTETYISLRRLENQVIEKLLGQEMVLGDLANPVKVSIQQFYGIEINDYACVVAKTALWIAELQMMQETQALVHMNLDFLPLKSYANIVEGNALRLDWNEVVPKEKLSYIMGNPPFIGYAYQTKEQKEDLQAIYNAKNMDYVAGWYFKAAEYITKSIGTAFVSTNSITQGEQVAVIWKPLMEKYGIHIDFAHRTFRWDSESTDKAAVHVVIVGFSKSDEKKKYRLYSSGQEQIVENISPYLIGAPTTFIERRAVSLTSDVPQMIRGNQPTDDGNLILTFEEYEEFIKVEPQAEKFIRPFMMGKDFINRKPRYCIWLVGANPAELKKCPKVLERVQKVRDFRLASKKKATQQKADTPTLFDEIRQPETNYIALPKVTSERRRYIPIDYLSAEIIAGDKLFMLPDATMYFFGVLMSNVHMAWMRTICGRLKSDYSYSNTIVYNNFPWPNPTDAQKSKIEKTAQGILDARAQYPDSSLADLYDELTMPPELRKAHQANDRAVMEAYGFDVKTTTESSCVAELMKMYQQLVEQDNHQSSK
ncbi:DNA methyltransferase [uncultured Anaerovibrio sp.]|nr:DNA methyltransferase [uncultured Anaerovibrio sp.]